MDSDRGVLKRTVTEPVRGRVSTTTYTQYAFPFGEAGSAGSPGEPQTLTVVAVCRRRTRTRPAAPGAAARARPSFSRAPGSCKRLPARPGRAFRATGSAPTSRSASSRADPNVVSPGTPACPGTTADAPFCASKSLRTVKRTFDYDDPDNLEGNRRVASRSGRSTAPGPAPAARTTSSPSPTPPATGKSNGRHYENEIHSGTLGGDSRTTYTDWAPANWTTGPPSGGRVLPNLFHERRVSEGASVRDELFEFDTSNGFLKGRSSTTPGRDLAFLRCRYDDGDGNVDKEFSKTFSSGTTPPRTYCSEQPSELSGVRRPGWRSVRQGLHLAERRAAVGAIRQGLGGHTHVPDAKLRARRHDRLGQLLERRRGPRDEDSRTTASAASRRSHPPRRASMRTFVCYEGPNATTAYRAAASQACPVSPGNASAKTWEHFDYDGLGRTAREKRLLPGAGVSKRFRLYDAAGNAHFLSEWVADAGFRNRRRPTSPRPASSPEATSRPGARRPRPEPTACASTHSAGRSRSWGPSTPDSRRRTERTDRSGTARRSRRR